MLMPVNEIHHGPLIHDVSEMSEKEVSPAMIL